MLTVHVSYELTEYLQVLIDFLPLAKSRRAIAAGKRSTALAPLHWHERLLVRALGSVAFIVKSRLIGACTFTIGAQGITRASKRGLLEVPWSEVAQVHKLSSSYLVEKSNGAMPIPFRVFSGEQRQALESLAGPKLVAHHAET
ncbi:YcxB family protein [Ideonella sp. DXS29W]|uniref:YcxB family protein n=1 Tax=Ideonella lacteola TaxID=2984193 RepID=A0ABU9BYI3_9BURK